MTLSIQPSDAELALARLWPRIVERFAKSQPKTRLNDFYQTATQEFPRLFENLRAVYWQQCDLYFHLENLLTMAANHWLSNPHSAPADDDTSSSWIESEQTIGATGYVDLFAGDLNGLAERADYLSELGINYLHLMPFFEVGDGDSDGGYAIKNYGAINPRLGTLDDLRNAATCLKQQGIKLVYDFVFNHTSDQHEWALKAKQGDAHYQKFYWLFTSTEQRDEYAAHLRDIFPDKRPGCFTWNDDLNVWVWTTFNSFQWDLNYSNPDVFHAMCGEMLKLVDAGADVIRLDALAFIWKQRGTACENLPNAHTLIQAFNAFLKISAPQVVLKSEAIVAPDEVIKYVSPDECPLSYNPNFMALCWEALATRQTRLLIAGSQHRSHVPNGSTWVNYLRCHDDIGWAFADDDAWQVGINPQDHRYFLNQFYTHQFPGSFAQGVAFQFNPKDGDCRICGTLASLVGLEQSEGIEHQHALKRILLLHAVMLGFKGIPLIYLGDELAMLNDHHYLQHPAHANDSRWVHRVAFDEQRSTARDDVQTDAGFIFQNLRQLIAIRKAHSVFGAGSIQILEQLDEHLFIFARQLNEKRMVMIANFSEHERTLSQQQCAQIGLTAQAIDLISQRSFASFSPLKIAAYDFYWFANSPNQTRPMEAAQ